MKRRDFISLLGSAAAAWPLTARAQQAMPTIGVLSPGSIASSARYIAAIRQGLRDLGYIEGRNIAIQYRYADGVFERLSILAKELVDLKPIMIVVGSTSGIVSASKVTQTIPLIAIGLTQDPVRLKLAESVARPGGNVTGFMLNLDPEIIGKRFQLLRDAVPVISRIGVIANPEAPGDAAELRMIPSMAARFVFQYQLLEARNKDDLEVVFATAARDGLQALYISWSPLLSVHRAQIVATAARLRLPAIYG